MKGKGKHDKRAIHKFREFKEQIISENKYFMQNYMPRIKPLNR